MNSAVACHSVQHSQAIQVAALPLPGPTAGSKKYRSFLFVLPILSPPGWLTVFLTGSEKQGVGIQCSPWGLGINSDFYLCSCSGVDSQAAACSLDLKDPFICVSDKCPAQAVGLLPGCRLAGPFSSSVKSSSMENLHNDKSIHVRSQTAPRCLMGMRDLLLQLVWHLFVPILMLSGTNG